MPAAASDHENYDRARDELAVPDPFDPIFEPAYTHGLVTVADSFSGSPRPRPALPPLARTPSLPLSLNSPPWLSGARGLSDL